MRVNGCRDWVGGMGMGTRYLIRQDISHGIGQGAYE